MPVPDTERSLAGRQKVRSLSRLARQALKHSCRISGLRLDRFPKDADGVPLPVEGVHWSISHKSDVVGGVAAPLPVGFDLETLRPVNDALLARVADAEEWRLASGQGQKAFFRFWTAKEAVLKAEGKGFAGLSRCRIVEIADETRMVLTFDGRRWPVIHYWFDGHVAALTPHQLEVSWRIVSPLD
jgi:4'-phosphopantetheinyl transferase